MIKLGYSYHIKDSFFEKVNDMKLMKNKENGKYRPHFVFIEDNKIKGLYWAIPQSTQVEKYKKIINEKVKKHKKCNTIILGVYGGRENAFLIQNMFPVIEKYVDHEHLISGNSISIHNELIEKIKANAKEVLIMHKRGINLVFPDIDKIAQMMIKELEEQSNDKQLMTK